MFRKIIIKETQTINLIKNEFKRKLTLFRANKIF